MITLENTKLVALISDKDELVNQGRAISKELDTIEVKIKRFEEKEKRITEKVIPPKNLTDRGDIVVKEITKLDEELSNLIKQINQFKLDAIPQEMKTEHEELMKQRETKERDRNKIALKVQKIKDKIIPIIQREVRPLMKDIYDDIETAQIKDGKVVIATFNHLDEFKSKFVRR